MFQDGVLYGTFVSLSVGSQVFLFVMDFSKRSTLLYCLPPQYSSKRIDSAEVTQIYFWVSESFTLFFAFRVSFFNALEGLTWPLKNQQLIHFVRACDKEKIPSTEQWWNEHFGDYKTWEVPLFNDFAHIPWEDTPDSPKLLQFERNSETETVGEGSGGPSSRGPCGWDLRPGDWHPKFPASQSTTSNRLKKMYISLSKIKPKFVHPEKKPQTASWGGFIIWNTSQVSL